MNTLALLASLSLAAPAAPEDPAPEPTVETPAPNSSFDARRYQLDDVAYERQMQLARTGFYVGAGGLVLGVGGGVVFVMGFNDEDPDLMLGGLAMMAGGGVALLVGPILTTVGSMSAAARLRDAGISVPLTAGWVSVAMLGAGLFIPGTHILSYVASGIQMGVNTRHLDDAVRRGITWTISADPRRRTVVLAGTF